MSIPKFIPFSPWARSFALGLLAHTVLVLVAFLTIVTTMKMPDSQVMAGATICAWMPIAFFDFPLNAWVLERYDVGFWEGFALLLVLGGVMWGVVALIASGVRAARAKSKRTAKSF